MIKVASVVEGDGEVAALPVLLRRLSAWLTPEIQTDVLTPIRVQRDRFLNKHEEFSRYLQLAAAKATYDGWVLILLDADDDCPARRAATLLADARRIVTHRRISVVFANREYEAWFIAAALSLDTIRTFVCRADDTEVEAETPRDAKGWMRERMTSGAYRETLDQAGFSARMDLALARERSRSFRKLCKEWTSNVISKP